MSDLLGLRLEPKDLGYLQVCLRALIVFVGTLIIVRIADRRFLGKMSAFDVVLGFMLASMLARAINGSAPFFPSLLGGLLLVLLHRLLATLAYRSGFVGWLIKGEARVLVENGRPKPEALRAYNISEKDLFEQIRLHGRVGSLEHVQTATIERNGSISVIPAKAE